MFPHLDLVSSVCDLERRAELAKAERFHRLAANQEPRRLVGRPMRRALGGALVRAGLRLQGAARPAVVANAPAA